VCVEDESGAGGKARQGLRTPNVAQAHVVDASAAAYMS
jgi:hypothetical protein